VIALVLLIPLLLLGGVIAAVAALAKRNDSEPQDGLVRRLVVSVLTFGMTIVFAVGVHMLIDVTLSSFDDLARSGSRGLASGLALTLVGAPAALLLWRYQLRSLAGPDGRSIVWLLYQVVASATFAIGTVVALGNGLQFHDFDSSARSSLVFGLVWLTVWIFHEWVGRRHPAPLLAGLPHAIGAAVGLVTAAFGGVAFIDAVLSQVADTDSFASSGVLDSIISSLVWLAVGTGVWVWQFFDRTSDDLSRAGLVLGFGVGGGAALGLGGLTGLVAILLSATTSGFEWDLLGETVGAVAVGFLVWRYHSGLATQARDQRIARHIVSGLSLIGLAVGIGVLVNAVLALLTPAFASRNETDLLWGAIAALVVNGPVWWLVWRPNRSDPDAGTTVQRTYLTLLGGVAALTGAIALIYLVFQLLEGLLEGASLSAIVDDIRAPFGFVAATGLVTAYHYRRWASSRTHDDKPAPMTVERVTFVGDPSIGAVLQSELGVRMTGWLSVGEGRVLSAGELADHIRDLDTTDVLVVEEERGFRVVRLARNNGHRPQTGEPQE
jgi:hypothetical protein